MHYKSFTLGTFGSFGKSAWEMIDSVRVAMVILMLSTTSTLGANPILDDALFFP